ncbi:MAG: PH domain-containing protein [Eubacterium sp.]|nr:PH domain-containing protein [Eubacterium sp.]MCI9411348.1 PH domain-containing protein [Eubacterium sp.]
MDFKEEYKERKRSLFFGLPLSFTTYTLTEKKINIKKGLLKTVEDDTLMYKVQDVTLVRGLFERIFGLGTVICYSSDVTDSKLMLTHIRNSSEVKEFILQTAEMERRKVRTVHTMGLDASEYSDYLETEDLQ